MDAKGYVEMTSENIDVGGQGSLWAVVLKENVTIQVRVDLVFQIV